MSCSMSGVPRITEMNIRVVPFMIFIFDILPNAMTKPSGSENSNVSAKMPRVLSIPSDI